MARHLTAALLRRIWDLRIALSEGAAGPPGAAGPDAEARRWEPDAFEAFGREISAKRRAPDARIAGTNGDDRVRTGAGDDVIVARGGNDRVGAGAGADAVRGDGGADALRGGTGADLLEGGEGRDRLHGEGGGDRLRGDAGGDRLWGGAGRDEARGGGGNDRIQGGGGGDDLRGERGDDLLKGGAGADRAAGGAGDDRLRGGGGNDRGFGGSGDDDLRGQGGRDQLAGGSGEDALFGGAGADLLLGGSGVDRLFGGGGDDRLAPGDGAGAVFGGDGRDVLMLDGAADEFDIAAFDGGGPSGLLLTRRATGEEIRVTGVEQVAWQGEAAVDLKLSSPVGAPADLNPSANRIREDAAAGADTGVRMLATDPDAGDRVSYRVDDPRFAIDAAGVMTVAEGAVFDADAEARIVATVLARSSDGSERAQVVFVDVTATQEALSASLAADTGRSAGDGVTREAALRVEVVGPAAGLSVALDGGAAIDIAGALDAEGAAVFAPAGLPDGAHEAVFRLDLGGGAQVERTVSFTLDRAAPRIERFGLAASSDTGARGDGSTGYDAVTLVGRTEPGARVEVAGRGAVADAGGDFVIAGVANPDGRNVFELVATDLAGNAETASLSVIGTDEAGPTTALDWTRIALERIAAAATGEAEASRTLAMTATAMHDAAAAFDGTRPALATAEAPAGGSLAAALAGAAHGVLAHAYPAFEGLLDQRLAEHLAEMEAGAAAQGRAFGAEVAARVIALRGGDGRDDFEPFAGSEEVGAWRPTGPGFDVAVDSGFATLETWSLEAPDQFRPGGPPAPSSSDFAEALSEVEALGASASATRTAEQAEAARFWMAGAGGVATPGRWLGIAADAAEAEGLSLSRTVDLMARVSVSVADAMIAAWDAKSAFGSWRPATAIRHGDAQAAPAAGAGAGAGWTPFLTAPSHPEYVSAHAAASGAAAAALASVLGDATPFTASSRALPGVERSYPGFSAAAAEAAESRVWAGVSFGPSADDGLALGADVAGWVLNAFERGEDSSAPKILFDFDADAPVVGRRGVALSGTALDGLSGLAGLSASIDGGAAQVLAAGADGAFSLLLEGLGDGTYGVVFEAVDAQGNAASRAAVAVLDAAAPTIAVTSLADGGELRPGGRLTGTADGTGSALTSLSWSVDGGPARALAAGGGAAAFDLAIDASGLTVGAHAIELRALDAAGNEAVETFEVVLAEAPAFEVISLTPGAGDRAVGLAQRPEVRFSRPVDRATFDGEGFFATDAAGARLPGTARLSADGLTGRLVFDDLLPGSQQITVHLDGARLADLDGVRLDGDGDGAPGGDFAATFATLSRTPTPGARLVGRVVDPGPDLRPMTLDDVADGADGADGADDVFLRPIVGATVRVVGFGDLETAVTDADGWFELTRLPAGAATVVIDGRTATNAPEGVHFPRVAMEAVIAPGGETALAALAGAADRQAATAGRTEIYLPRIDDGVLQALSASEAAVVTVPAAGAPHLTAAQRSLISLSVDAGATVDAEGRPVEGGLIGLSAPPPELMRGRLPDGLLQHAFGLILEAPGAAAFATPAALTLPNVFGAAPGAQLNMLRLDPATGRLRIEGTATASPDGLTVTTDAGGGVAGPGWLGLAPPGGNAGDGSGDWGGDGGVGFDLGEDHLAVKIDGAWLRTVTDADGGFDLFLPEQADYEVRVFDPVSGLLATGFGTTPRSGRGADLTSGLAFGPSTGVDSDFDGLSDEIEITIGSSALRADSNGDGVDDLASLRLGLDPAAARADAAGPVGALRLGGSIEQVLTPGPAAGVEAPLAVLRTASGLAVLDLTNPRAPILMRELVLDRPPTAIGFDPVHGRLTVVDAAAAVSLALGDLIALGAEAGTVAFAMPEGPGRGLYVHQGVAYLGAGSRIEAYDVATGALLSSIDVGGQEITALTGEGDLLAAVTSDGAVAAVTLAFGGAMTLRGAVQVGFNQGDLKPVLAEGLLHLPADNGFTGGYATVDLSDPDAPALVSGPDDTTLSGEAMALNGSGLGLLVGSPGGAHVIDLVDASDPQDTGAPVARFEAGAAPRSVAIAQGLGLVGLQDGTLLTLDPVGRDRNGVAPTATLLSLPEDVDLAAEGRQVLEGALIALDARATDDVQVARVELLLNGRVVREGASLGRDPTLRLPTLAELGVEGGDGGAPVALQIRAFDMAGLIGVSDVAELRLVPDTAAPELLDLSLSDGDSVGRSPGAVRLLFSEPLDADAIEGALRLTGAGGLEILPDQLAAARDGRELIALFPELPLGALTLELDRSRVRDAAGNALGEGAAEVRFTAAEFTLEWTGAASDRWEVDANWSPGRAPTPQDDVRVDAQGEAPVRLSGAAGSAHAGVLVARDPLVVEAGATLRVSGDAILERLVIGDQGVVILEAGAVIGTLVIDRGRLIADGDVLITERLEFAEGEIAGAGRVVVAQDAAALLGDAVEAVEGRSYVQALDLSATLELRGEATLEHARLVFGGGSVAPSDGPQAGTSGSAHGALIVAPGGTLELRGADADLDHWLGQAHDALLPPELWREMPGGLTNDGLLRKTGGGESRLDGRIGGDGAYEMVEGTLVIEGRAPISALRGLEEVRIADGVLIIDEAASLPRLMLDGGAVVGAFDLQVTESLRLRDGASLRGPGRVVLAEGAEGLIGDREAEFEVDPFFQTSAVYLWAELEARGALQVELAQVFFNLRRLDEAGDEIEALDGVLRVAESGSLDLVGRRAELRPFHRGLGEDVLVDGALSRIGDGAVRIGVQVTGEGRFDFGQGAVTIIDGAVDAAALAGAADLRVEGGALVVAEGVELTVATLTLAGGALEVMEGGRLIVTGRLDWTGGSVRGEGELELGAAARGRLGPPPSEVDEGWPGAALTLAARLAVSGELTLEHGALMMGGAGPGPGEAVLDGRLEVRAGGTLVQSGHAAEILGDPGAANEIVNEGEIVVRDGALRTQVSLSGGGTWTFENGVIIVTGGTVELSGLGAAEAIVVLGGVLIVNEAVAVERLELRGGVLDGAGEVTATQSFAWLGGAMQGAGTTRLAAGAVGLIGVDPDVDAAIGQPSLGLRRRLEVDGDVRHLSAEVVLGGGPAAPGGGGAAAPGGGVGVGVIDVAAGASWTFESFRSDISGGEGAANVLRNDGVLRKIGGGVSVVDPGGVALEGGGAIEALDGELRIDGRTFGSWAPPDAAPRPGDPLEIGETLTLAAGEALDALTLSGGVLVLDGDARIESLTFTAGLITGDGDLTLGDRLNWEGGRMAGGGETTTEAGAAVILGRVWDENSPEQAHVLQLDRALILLGDARIEQARVRLGGLEFDPDAGASVDRAGRIELAEGATLDFAGIHSELQSSHEGFASFVNEGVARKTGLGASTFAVDVSGGGAFVQEDGAFRLGAGGTLTLDGGEGIDRLIIDGGTLVLEGDATLATLELLGGRVEGAGSLDVSGRLAWRAGVLAVEGGVDLLAGAEGDFGSGLPPLAPGFRQDLDLQTTLNLFGDATLRDGRVDLGRRGAEPGPVVTDVGRLHVREGAELTLSGPSSDVAAAELDTPFLGAQAGMQAQMAFLINDGLIRHVGEGRSQLSGLIDGDGAFASEGPAPGFEVGPGGALVLDGSLAIEAVHIAGGLVSAEVDAALSRLSMGEGLLTGPGDVFVSERLEVGASALLAGPGRLVVQEGAQALIGAARDPDQPPTSVLADISRDLRIEGEALFQQVRAEFSGSVLDPARSLSTFAGGALEIAPTGVVTLDGPGVTLGNAGPIGVSPLINHGTLRRTGGGLAEIGLDYAGDGALDLSGGETAWIFGADIAASDLAGLSGLRIDGARLDIDEDASLARLVVNDGLIFGDGDLTVTDMFRFEDGTIRGDGALILPAGAEALLGREAASAAFAATPVLARDVALSGDATVQLAYLTLYHSAFDPEASQTVARGSTFAVLPEGTLELAGAFADIDGVAGLSALVNQGLVRKTGAGQATIPGQVDYREDGGAIEVLGGSLRIDGDVLFDA